MEIYTFCITPFAQNCRVLADPKSMECAVIDPGGEAWQLFKFITDKNFTLKSIILTHSHIDHVGGLTELEKLCSKGGHQIKVYGHKAGEFFRQNVEDQALYFGLDPKDYLNCREPDVYLEDGDEVFVGDIALQSLFTPGHEPGHLSFYIKRIPAKISEGDIFSFRSLSYKDVFAPIVISGDALFLQSVGRTDLPQGNYNELLHSIRTKLFTLPDETIVMSGHGPNTTIGQEKKTNPFLN